MASFVAEGGTYYGLERAPSAVAAARLFGGLVHAGLVLDSASAVKVFGHDHVALAVNRVCRELFSWGYGTSLGKREIPSVVCTALLLNRSPVLEDLTLDILLETRVQVGSRALAVVAVHVSRALASLGCIEDRLTFERKPRPDLDYATRTQGVPGEWLCWCERWRDTSTYTPRTRQQNFSRLLMIGRWLAAERPEIASPADWTREVAASWVASSVCLSHWSPCMPC